MHARLIAAATIAALTPTIACAQMANAPDNSVYSGDFLMIGGGAIYAPSYEGSNNMVVSPIPIVTGRYDGITLSPRADGVSLNIVAPKKGAKISFAFGPLGEYSTNRSHDIEDPVVIAAGKLKSAFDLGFNAGIGVNRVLDPYDSLTLSTDVAWNVNGSYKGMTISPSISYFTPLSKGAMASLSVSAKHVDDNYATYYYNVSPTQSLASGLPIYSAHGGWASVGATLLAVYDLDHNLLNGGFSIVGIAGYQRLINDAEYTPYTSIRGSSSQWTVGGGVAYTF